ncbi:MAG: hypothetical protein HC850_09205 [Rhodomicrobium sp.]|nr:hypothetical protein [Rhodomicrobium sp.]
MTADHGADIAHAVMDSGYGFLTKPIEPAELRALMSHLLTMSGHSGGKAPDIEGFEKPPRTAFPKD